MPAAVITSASTENRPTTDAVTRDGRSRSSRNDSSERKSSTGCSRIHGRDNGARTLPEIRRRAGSIAPASASTAGRSGRAGNRSPRPAARRAAAARSRRRRRRVPAACRRCASEWPTALAPGHHRRASRSLMTTTSGPSRVSASPERPALQDPLAERLEVTGRCDPQVGARRERQRVFVRRSGWRGPRRYRATRPAAAHRAEPRRSRRHRPHRECRRQPPLDLLPEPGDRAALVVLAEVQVDPHASARRSVVNPVSMPCRCRRLRTESVAAIISTNDSATCPATRPPRRRPAAAPEAPSPERRTNSGTAAADRQHDDARRPPRRRPPRWSSPDRREGWWCAARTPSASAGRTARAAAPAARRRRRLTRSRPAAATRGARRVAPSADRNCISRQRRVNRVSVRLPTLTQAISSTSAAAATRSSSVGRSSCRISAASGDAVAHIRSARVRIDRRLALFEAGSHARQALLQRLRGRHRRQPGRPPGPSGRAVRRSSPGYRPGNADEGM